MGFRALKKALETPYTTKVNNRVRTSRGTTLNKVLSGLVSTTTLHSGTLLVLVLLDAFSTGFTT